MAGRVYSIFAEPGVRDAMGLRFYLHTGQKLKWVQRVAFDDDADEGMATVRFVLCNAEGSFNGNPEGPFVDPETMEACTAEVRTWVKLVRPGESAPAWKCPILFRQPDGKLVLVDEGAEVPA